MSLSRCAWRGVRLAAAITLLLAGGTHTHADEATSATRHAARDIIKIMDAHNDRGVLEFQAGHHDAWKVSFHLVTLERADLAREFARTTGQPDLDVVLEKIDAWNDAELDAEVVARWTAMDGARERREWREVLEHWKQFGANAPPFLRLDGALICARARFETGDLDGAFELLKFAPQQAKDMGWIWGQARAYWRLGHVHHQRGEYASALENWTRCVAAYDRRGDARSAAMARGNVAALYLELGDTWPAITLLEEGLEVYRKHNADGTYTKTIIRQLQNLAWARVTTGPHASALSAFQEARDLAVSIGRETDVVESDIGLATVLRRLGEWERAEAAALAAEKRAKALGDLTDEARAQGTLGLVHFDAGEFEKARTPYERALATLEAMSQDEALSVRTRNELSRWADVAKGNLAHTLIELDEDALARLHFKQVLASKHLKTASEVDAREGLGLLHHKAGNYDKALAELEKARTLAADAELVPMLAEIHTAIAETQLARGKRGAALDAARTGIEFLSESTRGLGHAQQARARARQMSLFHIGMQAAAEIGDVKAFNEVLESSRAFALLELLEDREALRTALIPPELIRKRQEAVTEEALARARFQAARRDGDLRAAREHRAAMREAQEELTIIVDDMQAAAKAGADLLYPKAASLDLIRRSLRPGDVLVQYALLPDRSYAAVSNRTTTRIVPLGKTKEIEALLETVIELSADPDADVGEKARALKARILSPLGIPGTKIILISADGPLYFAPLGQLLSDDRDILYVPSGTAVQRQPKRPKPVKDILAFGDPHYAKDRRLAPLPESGKEATNVGTEVVTGDGATETALRARLATDKRWRSVHLACHGRFDSKRPMQSALHLRADTENDGRLTCEEVFQMKIQADLVVLSACETGRGDVQSAEGLIGLTRAFLVAGATRVLCSLWKVDDAATRAFMEKFYEEWNAGEPMSRALDVARKHVRSQPKWSHPYYWAAWVVWGMSV